MRHGHSLLLSDAAEQGLGDLAVGRMPSGVMCSSSQSGLADWWAAPLGAVGRAVQRPQVPCAGNEGMRGRASPADHGHALLGIPRTAPGPRAQDGLTQSSDDASGVDFVSVILCSSIWDAHCVIEMDGARFAR